jgi:hypothetical protein
MEPQKWPVGIRRIFNHRISSLIQYFYFKALSFQLVGNNQRYGRAVIYEAPRSPIWGSSTDNEHVFRPLNRWVDTAADSSVKTTGPVRNVSIAKLFPSLRQSTSYCSDALGMVALIEAITRLVGIIWPIETNFST